MNYIGNSRIVKELDIMRLRHLIQKYFAHMEPKKNTARRDRLIELESRAQYLWRRENVFHAEVDHTRPKYFETFPYPYMNGRLHLGHGFSLTKCDFNARYKALNGFNVLFPFGFHCTGTVDASCRHANLRSSRETAKGDRTVWSTSGSAKGGVS